MDFPEPSIPVKTMSTWPPSANWFNDGDGVIVPWCVGGHIAGTASNTPDDELQKLPLFHFAVKHFRTTDLSSAKH